MNCNNCKFFWNAKCHNKNLAQIRDSEYIASKVEEVDTDIISFLTEGAGYSIFGDCADKLEENNFLKKTPKIKGKDLERMSEEIIYEVLSNKFFDFQVYVERTIRESLQEEIKWVYIPDPSNFCCSFWE